MAINDGQRVRALESNAAWVSKTATTGNDVTGIIDLNNPSSGAQIPNAQQQINDTNDRSIQNESDIAALDVRVTTAEADIDQAQLDITDARTDIDDLRTLSGTADGDVDLGTFTGTTIPDNVAIKPALQSLETSVELRELASNKGIANGYASLDGAGLVPASQLPSYVDDVLEFANLAAFPVTGETGKIYVALDTNKTYRWSGSIYILLNEGGVVTVQGRSGVTLIYKVANDNTSGSNVALAAIPLTAQDLTSVIRLTNAALVSIDTIPAGYSGQPVTLVNRTTVAVDVSNDTGATAANRILTGTGATLTLEPDASLNLVYDDTTQRWQIVGGSGSGGAAISVPLTTTVNAVVRWNATDGTAIKDSPHVVTDAGVSTGLTDQTVGTVKTALNKIEGTQSNTDFDLDANGTGAVKSLASFKLNEALRYNPQTDSIATGTNATLAAPLTTILIVDNTSLVSIEGITAGSAWQEITLINKTGNPLQIFNETGTAANQIVNSNLQNILLGVNGSLKLIYDATLTKWFSQRTDFVTMPFTSDWITYTPTISTDAGVLPTRSSEVFRYRVDGPDYLITARVAFSGTGTGGGFYIFTLPNGHTIRTSVVSNSNFDSMGVYGVGGWYDQSSSPQGPIIISGKGTANTLACYGSDKATGAIIPTNANIGNGDFFNFTIRVPANELASNSFTGTANQVASVKMEAFKNAGTATASTTIASWTGEKIDNYNAFNSTTGVFTIPKQTDYIVIFNTFITATTVVFDLFRNGVTYKRGINNDLAGNMGVWNIPAADAAVGTTFDIRPNANVTFSSNDYGAVLSFIENSLSNTSINTGPISLGTRAVVDDQTNATTTAEFFQSGPFIEMLGSMVFTGVPTGGEVNMTIPAEFAASSVYNAGATRPSVGYITLNDASAPYGGSANLTSTTNIRLYANSSGSLSNINTTNPFTWVSGDTIFFHLKWKKA